MPQQLAMLREQLEEQQQFRLDQLAELHRDVALSGPDVPAAAVEVQRVLMAGARAALTEILAAIRRMDAGTYGRCVDCDRSVPIERLEILPHIAHCGRCQRGPN